ncbi:unnamed protein product [Urochloa humidicola]
MAGRGRVDVTPSPEVAARARRRHREGYFEFVATGTTTGEQDSHGPALAGDDGRGAGGLNTVAAASAPAGLQQPHPTLGARAAKRSAYPSLMVRRRDAWAKAVVPPPRVESPSSGSTAGCAPAARPLRHRPELGTLPSS